MTMQLTQSLQRIRPSHGYYRKADGRIGVAVVTMLEEMKYRQEGWVPLPQYGRFDLATEYAVDHPFEALFISGGAHELPVEQVLAMGFHLWPPVIPACGQLLTQYHKEHNPACWQRTQTVDFPQLRGLELPPPSICRFCGIWKPSEVARDQHEFVMHKDRINNVQMGDAIASALKSGMPQAQTPEEALRQLKEELRRELLDELQEAPGGDSQRKPSRPKQRSARSHPTRNKSL